MKANLLQQQQAGKRRSPTSKTWAIFSSPWLYIALFSGLGLIGVLNHAMWRDEFNTWLIVRDSHSLREMLGWVKYQGHTALWALSIAFLRNFSHSPVIMQLFHWVIAVLAITIFWRYSPFTHRQKILFTFGYIPFYQYLLIARPYGMGMLFLFVFCAIFPFRQKSYIPAAILLSLMANSSAYGLFIATALGITLAVEWIFSAEQRSRYRNSASRYDFFLSLLIILLGFGFAAYILTPPIDSYNHGGLDVWHPYFDLRRIFRALGRIFAAYTLIVPSQHKWPDLIICGSITLVVLALFLLKLVRKPLAFCFFSVAHGILLAFTYLRFMGIGPRHFAHFYLVLIAAVWLAAHLPDSPGLMQRFAVSQKLLAIANQGFQYVFIAILVIQFLGGLYGLPRDLLIPFSAARETANYIKVSGWQDEFIVASRDANMASISGYLDRKLYYPELQGLGSFTVFGGERKDDHHEDFLSHEEVLRQVAALLTTQGKKRILLILHQPLQTDSPVLEIASIREFTHSWTDSERYYLYWVILPS